ncbi:EXPERA domain-containing protein [Aspergillus mulundensis]|uniref:EXPERA domain-containing protein n=1 Tax=Aspergillus mulundensis TaxID=1810919 RepID=A0A3D8RRQ3_9EURO|nr:hypothetical protein DSM5745_06744 [Aspergillus mulundensis]RDW76752.1 hypothetical protein DSM5745_06744 [Aspergillus mulundensis]
MPHCCLTVQAQTVNKQFQGSSATSTFHKPLNPTTPRAVAQPTLYTSYQRKQPTRASFEALKMSTQSPPSTFTLDTPTILCILFALSFMPIAYFAGQTLIPSSQTRNRLLFYWHAYDALTHLFIEGSFLYECFTSYAVLPAGLNAPEPAFLGIKDRVYGAAYGTAPSSRLWQEYAKADHRWASADATVISLELLTVFLGGPAAVYVCYLLWQSSLPSNSASASSSKTSSKATPSKSNSSRSSLSSSTSASTAKAEAEAKGAAKAKLWLVATALATAELYGGFMTFAPEWLTGSTQLDTSNAVYTWFYLFFFNTLWVWIPLWVLFEAGKEVRRAFVLAEGVEGKEGKKAK